MKRDTRETEYRVSEARRLLDEPLLNEALDKIERQAIEEMLRLDREDDDGRRLLADHVRVIRSIKAHLSAIITAGEVALRTIKVP